MGSPSPICISRTDDDAASDLFYVAAGLESVVPGEWQILDQVRQALKSAANQAQDLLATSESGTLSLVANIIVC